LGAGGALVQRSHDAAHRTGLSEEGASQPQRFPPREDLMEVLCDMLLSAAIGAYDRGETKIEGVGC